MIILQSINLGPGPSHLIWCLFFIFFLISGSFISLIQSYKLFPASMSENNLDFLTGKPIAASSSSSAAASKSGNEESGLDGTVGSTGLEDIYYETSYHDHFSDRKENLQQQQEQIEVKLDKIIRLVDYKSDLESLRVDKLDIAIQRSFRALEARLDKLESKMDLILFEQSKAKTAPSVDHHAHEEEEEEEKNSLLLNRVNKVYNIHQETYRICKEALLTGSSSSFSSSAHSPKRGRKNPSQHHQNNRKLNGNQQPFNDIPNSNGQTSMDIEQYGSNVNGNSTDESDLDPETSSEIDHIVMVLNAVINDTLDRHLNKVRKTVAEELNIVEYYANEKYKNSMDMGEKMNNLRTELLESSGQLSTALIDLKDGQAQNRDLLNRMDDEIVAIMTTKNNNIVDDRGRSIGNVELNANNNYNQTKPIDEQTIRALLDEYVAKILAEFGSHAHSHNHVHNHSNSHQERQSKHVLLITNQQQNANELLGHQTPITVTLTPVPTSATTTTTTTTEKCNVPKINSPNPTPLPSPQPKPPIISLINPRFNNSKLPNYNNLHRLIYTNPWIRFLDFGKKFVTHKEEEEGTIRKTNHNQNQKQITSWSTETGTGNHLEMEFESKQSTTSLVRPLFEPLVRQQNQKFGSSGQNDCTKQSNAYFPDSCYKLLKGGATCNEVYTILTETKLKRKVFCDMEHNGGGWTVILRRGKSLVPGNGLASKSVRFDTNLSHYWRGFGVLQAEHFVGLDLIHLLTSAGQSATASNGNHKGMLLQVDLEDTLGNYRSFVYDGFRIGPASDGNRFYINSVIATSKGISLGSQTTEQEFRLASSLLLLNGTKFLSNAGPRHSQLQRCRAMFQSNWWYSSESATIDNQTEDEKDNQNYCQIMAPVQLMAPLQNSLSHLSVYWQGWNEGKLRFVTMKVKERS